MSAPSALQSALVSALALAAAVSTAAPAPAQDELGEVPLATTSQRAKFIAVNLGDDSRKADEKLAGYLNNMVPTVYFVLELGSYETVVESLASWDSSDAFLARLTPYVYLAAESLGAELVPLASYKSKATGEYTYRSYLIVRKGDLETDQPTPGDVLELIRARNEAGERARFRYHSKFSTSSYYLPSLFFLEHHVFNMEKPAGSLLAIDSRRIDSDSSSALVRMVAAGGSRMAGEPDRQEADEQADGADLAAVWDGTKAKFCSEAGRSKELTADGKPICDELHFIPLDTLLPNDLLVASASMDDWTRTRLQTAITTMGDREINTGDFLRWEDIRQAHEARTALFALIRKSRQAPARITVDVRADKESKPPVLAWQKKAVEEAIELSGTELTVWERYFHRRADFEWTLKLTHDGALLLTSRPSGFLDPDALVQSQIMSFEDEIDLIDRTTGFIAGRMHRVRYIWPYWNKPTVIRDLPFALPEAGTRLQVSRIVWEEFEKNGYLTDRNDWFTAEVEHSDFNKLRLSTASFPRWFPRSQLGDLQFDPMSNVWHRVLLVRESKESELMRALTWVFMVVLVLGAVGVVLDFYRPDWMGALWRRRWRGRASAEKAHA